MHVKVSLEFDDWLQQNPKHHFIPNHLDYFREGIVFIPKKYIYIQKHTHIHRDTHHHSSVQFKYYTSELPAHIRVITFFGMLILCVGRKLDLKHIPDYIWSPAQDCLEWQQIKIQLGIWSWCIYTQQPYINTKSKAMSCLPETLQLQVQNAHIRHKSLWCFVHSPKLSFCATISMGVLDHMHGFAQGPMGREESVLLKPAPSLPA